MCTSDASILATLGFGEGGWDMQQQVIAVLEPDAAPESLDADKFLAWLNPSFQSELPAVLPQDVRLMLVAGHDGEWASAIASERDTLLLLRNALHVASTAAGIRWVEGDGPLAFHLGGYGPWPV